MAGRADTSEILAEILKTPSNASISGSEGRRRAPVGRRTTRAESSSGLPLDSSTASIRDRMRKAAKKEINAKAGIELMRTEEARHSAVKRRSRRHWISSPSGEKVMTAVICVNAVLLFLETDFKDRSAGATGDSGVNLFWSATGWAFVFIYLIEIVWRFLDVGCRRFWYSVWNCFDLFIIFVGTADAVLDFMNMQILPIDVMILRVLRFLRLARLARLLRLEGVVKEMTLLIEGLVSTLRVLWKLLLVIGLFFACVSLLTTQAVGHPAMSGDLDTVTAEEQEELADWYGSISKSLFTLYVLSIGDDAASTVRLTAKAVPSMWFVLTGFSIFMMLAVLNLMTAVIVDVSINARAKEEEEEKKNKESAERKRVEVSLVHDIFKLADTDNSGWLSFEQYDGIFTNPTVRDKVSELGFSVTEAKNLGTMIDMDNNQEITMMELIQGFSILRRCSGGDTTALLHRDLLRCHDLVHREVLTLKEDFEHQEDLIHRQQEMINKQQEQIAQLAQAQSEMLQAISMREAKKQVFKKYI